MKGLLVFVSMVMGSMLLFGQEALKLGNRANQDVSVCKNLGGGSEQCIKMESTGEVQFEPIIISSSDTSNQNHGLIFNENRTTDPTDVSMSLYYDGTGNNLHITGTKTDGVDSEANMTGADKHVSINRDTGNVEFAGNLGVGIAPSTGFALFIDDQTADDRIALLRRSSDGGRVTLNINNSFSASSSLDEEVGLQFNHGTQGGPQIVAFRTEDYTSSPNNSSGLDFYVHNNDANLNAMQINPDGTLEATARTDASCGIGNICSGTITAVGNQCESGASTACSIDATWSRIGNIVTVTGENFISAGFTASTRSEWHMPVPVGHEPATNGNCQGLAQGNGAADRFEPGEGAFIKPRNDTSHPCTLSAFWGIVAAQDSVYFTYQYDVTQ